MDNPEKFDANYIEKEAKKLIESLELEETEDGREMSDKKVPSGKERTEKGKEKAEKKFVVVIKNPYTNRLVLETTPQSEQEARAIVEEMKEKYPELDVEIKE